MAFFKFRKGGDEQAAHSPAPESVEALRKRARHRLIGSAVLVLIGVIGFPLVFDNQPRPVAVDIPIEIPDRAKVVPLTTPPAPTKTAVASAPIAPVASEPAPTATARVSGGTVSPAPVTAPAASAATVAKVAPKPETKPEPKPAEVKSTEKPAEKVVAKPTVKSDDAAKAQALLEGKDVPKPVAAASAAAAGTRFIVQVGAYADAVKAREARMKLEKAGLKTYTQVVNPPEGKRIRVRVGPYESKAEADKIADKIKKLDLSAQILEL
jgi:DedD protein